MSSMIPAKASVSNTLSTPWRVAMVRSRPMPVSTFFWARGSNFPSPTLLYSMNTLFQISRYLPQSQPALQSGPQAGRPVSKKISVSGPQGPVSPAGPHQLFFLGRYTIWEGSAPISTHRSWETVSRGASASPSKQVKDSFSLGMPSHFSSVKNSQLQAMDSFLK